MSEIKGTTKITYSTTEAESVLDQTKINSANAAKYQELISRAEGKSNNAPNEKKFKLYNFTKNKNVLRTKAKQFVEEKISPKITHIANSRAYNYGKNKFYAGKDYLVKKINKNLILKTIIEKSLHSVEVTVRYIIRPETHASTKTDVLKYTRSPAIFGVWVTIITLLFMLIWGFLAPLNSAARVEGVLALESKKRILQSQLGGLIKRIYVKDGDEIEKGEILISLDKTAAKARVQSLKLRLFNAEAENARLVSERDNNPQIKFPEDLLTNLGDIEIHKIITMQEKLFKNKKEVFEGKILAKLEQAKQFENKLNTMNEQLVSIDKQIEISVEQYNTYLKLTQNGNLSKYATKDVEQRIQEFKSKKSSIVAEIANAKDMINQNKIEQATEKSSFLTDVERDLRQNQDNLENLRATYTEEKNNLENLDIVAPVSGVVSNLAHVTEGGIISREMPIVEIVPQDDKLIFDGKISPQDIDVVHVGQTSLIRLSPFKSRVVPPIEGTVISVSADLVMPKYQGEQPHYKVKIEFDPEEVTKIEKGKGVKFYPGMPGDGSIEIGTRTFMKYLFDPITTSFSKAFIEQ